MGPVTRSAKPELKSYNTLVAMRGLVHTEVKSLADSTTKLVAEDFNEFGLRSTLASLRLTEQELNGYDVQIQALMEDNLVSVDEETGEKTGQFTDIDLQTELQSRFYYERLLRKGIVSVDARLEMEKQRMRSQSFSNSNTVPGASASSWPEWEVERVQLQRESLEISREAAAAAERRGGRRPYVDPEVFDGKMTIFKGWWEMYKERVHDNDYHCPTKTEKFAILKRVIGPARTEIAGLGLSDENYTTAIQLIKKRYDNDEAIKNEHLRQLLEMNKYEGGGSNFSDSLRLRAYILEIERILCELQNLGVQVDNESAYVTIVTSKLPPRVIEKLLRRRTTNAWKMSEVRRGLRDILDTVDETRRFSSEATAVDAITPPPPSATVSALAAPRRQQPSMTHPRQSSFRPSGPNPAARSSTGRCIFCDVAGHTSGGCPTVTALCDRRDAIVQQDRCFICLGTGHLCRFCPDYSRRCNTWRCRQERPHHYSLCPFRQPPQLPRQPGFQQRPPVPSSTSRSTSNLTAVNATSQLSASTDAAISASSPRAETDLIPVSVQDSRSDANGQCLVAHTGHVIFQTATATVLNPNLPEMQEKCRLMLDTMSSSTYITLALAQRLDLALSAPKQLLSGTFGDPHPRSMKVWKAQINILLPSGNILPIHVDVVEHITCDLDRLQLPADVLGEISQFLPLADTLPVSQDKLKVDFLLGCDYYLDIILERKVQLRSGLWLKDSLFGWIISGRLGGSNALVRDNATQHICSVSHGLHSDHDIEVFWRLETLGITQNEMSDEDKEALSQVSKSITHDGQRYVVTFPKRANISQLPDNYCLARARLEALRKEFVDDPAIFEKYNAILLDQLQKGVIEVVHPDMDLGFLQHYIAHRAHVTPQRTTTKVRVVYNASARTRKDQLSLNDCLLRGPNMLCDLPGLLIRFRLHPIAIISDIEKAFLQVGVVEEERDMLRFLWFPDFCLPKDPAFPALILRFARVPFGVISSPFLLQQTVDYHLQRQNTPLAEDIRTNIYMDNVFGGCATFVEAQRYYTESKKLLQGAGMNLREFTSNCKELRDILADEDKQATVVKVLGVKWDTLKDTVSFAVPTPESAPTTKREVLRVLHQIYDPCGYLLPVTILWRLVLQKAWKAEVPWDVELPPSLLHECKRLVEQLPSLGAITLPRFIGVPVSTSQFELVGFCDASELGYGGCVYLRSTMSDGEVTTSLLFARGRITPEKKVLSIPRLELLSNVVLIRILAYVKEQLRLPIETVLMFTDSQTVLHWLKGDHRLSVFVANRIKEIRNLSTEMQVEHCYVPTKDNPADLISRGVTVEELVNKKIWLEGPAWLRKGRSEWPVIPLPPLTDTVRETVASEGVLHSATLVQAAPADDEQCFICEIDVTRFSKLHRFLKTLCYTRRFIRHTRKETSQCLDLVVTAEEMAEARFLAIKDVQQNVYEYVQHDIVTGSANPLVRQLRLYQGQDGLIRTQSRLDKAAGLSANAKRPILLPKDHPFTNLIVLKAHEHLMHVGVQHTLAAISTEFYIPKGKNYVRRLLKTCRVCRYFDVPPFQAPEIPALPSARVSESAPFSHTGLDFFGPLFIRSNNGEKTRCDVLLCTCMATRAVHLELMDSMTAASLLLAFRRFFATCGMPQVILSDNARSFQLTDRVLVRLWDNAVSDRSVQNHLADHGVRWLYIPDRAPWWGGFYERLVGVVKGCLKKQLGPQCLTHTELSTVLAEVAVIVNSRPLVFDSTDPEASVLTPLMFLTGRRLPCVLPHFPLEVEGSLDYKETSADKLASRWRKLQECIDSCWRIFNQDYLRQLKERHQDRLRQPRSTYKEEARVGDVVIIYERLVPRGSWKLGRIVAIHRGQDGAVRTATMRLANGTRILRSVTHLYPLECDTLPIAGQATANPTGVPACPTEGSSTASPGTTANPTGVPARPTEGSSTATPGATNPNSSVPNLIDQDPHGVPVANLQDGGEREDDWICPICQVDWADDDSDMVGCDGCWKWFHYHCLGISKAPATNQWFCSSCKHG